MALSPSGHDTCVCVSISTLSYGLLCYVNKRLGTVCTANLASFMVNTPWRRMDSGCIATPLLISTLAAGEWSASRPGRFTRGESVQVPVAWEAGWTSDPVWTLLRRKESLTPGRNRVPIPPSSTPKHSHYAFWFPEIIWPKLFWSNMNCNFAGQWLI
jgi:hypothetical protein